MWLKADGPICLVFCLQQKRGHLLIVLGFLSFQVSRDVSHYGPRTQQAWVFVPTGHDSPGPQDVSYPQCWLDRLCACWANPSVNPAGGQDPTLSLGCVLDHKLKTFGGMGLLKPCNIL